MTSRVGKKAAKKARREAESRARLSARSSYARKKLSDDPKWSRARGIDVVRDDKELP